jgi:hypothetical protein
MTAVDRDTGRLPRWLAILLVCLAGLLLEVGYTRIVSYKLWYYYTYLVIGLALLGIGSGGVFVAIFEPIKRAATDRVIALCSIWGAVSIAIGYLIIARLPINTVVIWDYGTGASFKNVVILAVISFFLFATFIALGIILATVFGRSTDTIGRLYFADLLGAGLGCLLAVPLIVQLGAPAVIILSALIFAVVGVLALPRVGSAIGVLGSAVVVVLAVAVVAKGSLPDVTTDETKIRGGSNEITFSEWGPVFRVDAVPDGPEFTRLLHDGTFGSGLRKFDGDAAALTDYETDSRAIPFEVLGTPPERELIIGSAGGNEILASLHYDAPNIDAVELNPVTLSLLTDHFADYTGHLDERPEVNLHQADGRSYLARSDDDYRLIWYPAPDSYAANNAASSGAFVLSESYLYTSEMIRESLEHLTDDGVIVVQFGELAFENKPNRTARYIVTARDAMEKFGIEDPASHIAVSVDRTEKIGSLSTIVLKRTPFTPEEIERFSTSIPKIEGSEVLYAPGVAHDDNLMALLASADDATLDQIVSAHPRDISAITDDSPYFWHFSSFPDVLRNITEPIRVLDPEEAVGERVLLLLLALSVLYAALFLLVPFFAVRTRWRALPSKGISAVYFAALGLGFMFFEITMIQRLTRFLGYPTYSLTVTLASLLVSTGIGALLSRRFADRPRTVMPLLLGALALLTLFYQFFLDDLTDHFLSSSLGVRVFVALVVLIPLGLCLGMFMPFGLAAVADLTPHGEDYVAWSWAVNGFFSVIGSVLTTMLSMTFGFRTVQYMALGVYAIAALAFTRLIAGARPGDMQLALADEAEPAYDTGPILERS